MYAFRFASFLCGIMQWEVKKMIAIVVRAIRRQKGWDRKQMAKILGVSAAYIGRVERGEQQLDEDVAKRLDEATGAKLSRLL